MRGCEEWEEYKSKTVQREEHEVEGEESGSRC